MSENMNLDFSTSPTVWKFINDKSFVRGIMGPVGSGKSYACAAELFKIAVNQKPSVRDGINIPGLPLLETAILCSKPQH